ncbi:YwdI family protein [Virgibacillus sp. MSP4-1]|uniref:YwdI family protein n=1 Tax=Virgibacillus sp. MSP4-1 TaxID=2700081 RepID=UPI0003A53045|nr:YwdI family protein [Virgibacillus sp. MSP4-1]QHS23610.1 YwdI family protein [Virgibacillus sp. MSP4-1]
MPVSDRKVLKKMLNEVHQAMENAHDPGKMKEHIKSVRVLTDLFIDEDTSTSETEVMRKLTQESVPESSATQQATTPSPSPSTGQRQTTIDHEGANGDSIFDF